MIKLHSIKKEHWILIGIGMTLGILCGWLPNSTIWPFAVLALGLSIGIFLILLMWPDDHVLFAVFTAALSLRVVISLGLYVLSFIRQINVTYLLSVKQGFFLGGDDYCYSANAWDIVDHWRRTGVFPDSAVVEAITLHYSANVTPYDYWNSFVYFLTDKSPITMFFLNSIFSCLTVIFIYDLSRRIFNKRVAEIAAFLSAFWPSLIFWSVINLREPLTIFLGVLCIWGVALFTYKIRMRYLLVGVFGVAAFFKFRPEFALVLLLSILVVILFIISRKMLLLLVLGILLIWKVTGIDLNSQILKAERPFLNASNNLSIGGNYEIFFKRLDYLRQIRSEEGRANLRFIQPDQIKNYPSLILYSPFLILLTLLLPFPWQLGSALQVLGAFESLIFYFLLVFLFAGVKKIIKDRNYPAYYLLFFSALTLGLLGLIEGNIGSLFRHKSVVLVFLFILIGVGIDYFKQKKETKSSLHIV